MITAEFDFMKMTPADRFEAAKRDDICEQLVPSDIRGLLHEIESLTEAWNLMASEDCDESPAYNPRTETPDTRAGSSNDEDDPGRPVPAHTPSP